jgi:hypothetical protein
MANLFTPVPDGNYEIRSFAVDQERGNVSAYVSFKEHTG